METKSRFEISLSNLPAEGKTYRWVLDDAFFSELDEQEIEHGRLNATLQVKPNSGVFEVIIDIQGVVQTTCDRCLAPMNQPIQTQQTLEVRLGEAYEDDGDVITVAADTQTLNVAWNLYEAIALAIPIYHVHPDGACEGAMDDLLQRHSADNAQTDSRWDALRSLLDNDVL